MLIEAGIESRSYKRKKCVCKQKIEEMFAMLRTVIKYKNLLQVDENGNRVEKHMTGRISIFQKSASK